MADKKLYTLQGTVLDVFPPQTVHAAKGNRKFTSQKTDVIMQTMKGTKVRVTFWNQEVDKDCESCDVSITNLQHKGKYKDVNQFSSTKESKVHVLGGRKEQEPDEFSSEEPTVEEPEVVQEPEVSGEFDEAADSVADPVAEEPTPAPKKRGRPAKKAVTGRESYREEAEQSTLADLRSAEQLATELGMRPSLTDLVALADRIGRTISAISADAGKDRRAAAIRK